MKQIFTAKEPPAAELVEPLKLLPALCFGCRGVRVEYEFF